MSEPNDGARPNATDPAASRMAPATAPRRLTGLVLSAGVALSAVCFVVALVAESLQGAGASGVMTDPGALIDGLVRLAPWAWAGLGVLVVVATPVAGLLATASEYAAIADRRTVLMALAVLGVLATSTVVAILR